MTIDKKIGFGCLSREEIEYGWKQAITIEKTNFTEKIMRGKKIKWGQRREVQNM